MTPTYRLSKGRARRSRASIQHRGNARLALALMNDATLDRLYERARLGHAVTVTGGSLMSGVCVMLSARAARRAIRREWQVRQ